MSVEIHEPAWIPTFSDEILWFSHRMRETPTLGSGCLENREAEILGLFGCSLKVQGKRQAQEGKPSENRRNKEGKSRPFPTVFPKKWGKPQADSRSLKANNRNCAGEHQEYDGKITGRSGRFLL